ncbi:MarR family transcriptional regulator [Grimontia sp. S25]|uniref:MarR family transcriptional regulator n=1 Tax=Grimontia sedimenti TaxID=2711294 RepID=A0A6M1R557_9GAMM|nr:MarR family transcriptional regulator [Grimontia sedimenti]NGN97415.1 MarR family transcriptional regulator [Grimontia sedimenti]
MAVADIDKQLCFALYSASNRVTSLYRQLLDPLGLTYTQFVVMMVLWKEDKLSITELASRAELSKATMTPLLKRLEQKGLIRRAALPDNDRQKSVVLTQEGIELSQNSADITDKVFCMTGLSAEEANTMISLCKKLGR